MRCHGLRVHVLALACAMWGARADTAPAGHDPWKGMEEGLARVQTLQRSLRAGPAAPLDAAEGPVFHLRYERPCRLRLQYDRRLLVADGTNLYVQEASGDLVRYALLPFTNTLDQLPPALFGEMRHALPDLHRLLQPDAAPEPHPWQSYAVELLPDEQIGGALCLHARLTATAHQPPGTPPFDVWFDRNHGLIRKLGPHAADHVSVNSPLPAGAFAFSPPLHARRMDRPERLFLAHRPEEHHHLTPNEIAALAEETGTRTDAGRELHTLNTTVATRVWSLPAAKFLRPAHQDTVARVPPATYTFWSDGSLVVLDAATGHTLHDIPAPSTWSANPDPNRSPSAFFLREGTQGVAVVWRSDDQPSPSRGIPRTGYAPRPLTAIDLSGHILWTTNLPQEETRHVDVIAGPDGRDALLVIDAQRLRLLDTTGRLLLDEPVPAADQLLVTRHGTHGRIAITTLAHPTARYTWQPAGARTAP